MVKYALITGASRGIGRATAYALAAKGYNLILICHNNIDALSSIVANINDDYPSINITTHVGDISNSEFCKQVFEHAKANNILPDIIINNAGISYVGLLQDMTDDEWHKIIETNLSSAFFVCREAIPSMIKKHSGKIINISSVWGNVGASCEVAYSASKGAINSFTKALAKELAPSNIQVNAIAFGAIDTDMNNHLSNEDKASLTDEIPSGRLGTANEAAAMILSVIDSPEYLTGQVITMDGSWC